MLAEEKASILDSSVVVIRPNPVNQPRFQFPCNCKIERSYKLRAYIILLISSHCKRASILSRRIRIR